MKEITRKDMGMEKFIEDETMVQIVREKEEMKVMPIPENDGQTMMNTKYDGAKKPWKPMGRK